MLRLIEFGILAVVLVVILRLVRGRGKDSRSSESQPPPSEQPAEKKPDKPL